VGDRREDDGQDDRLREREINGQQGDLSNAQVAEDEQERQEKTGEESPA